MATQPQTFARVFLSRAAFGRDYVQPVNAKRLEYKRVGYTSPLRPTLGLSSVTDLANWT